MPMGPMPPMSGPPQPPAPMGAPSPQPPPPQQAAPPVAPPLQLSPDDVGLWWQRIELSRKRRKTESDQWQKLFHSYLPPTDGTDDLNSNIHFRNVHLKIAEVWAQLPELKLTPLEPLNGILDPQTGQPVDPTEVVAVKRAHLNKLLGRDHANVNLTIVEALFDIFATSGIGATKICYQADMQPTPMQVPGPPVPQPGAVLGLQSMPGPTVTQVVDVPVFERYRWYRFSPEKLGIPHDWHSTDYDEAPYLFMEFIEPNTPQARKLYQLTDDFQGTASADDLILKGHTPDPGGSAADLIKGVEVWLKAACYDPDVAHTQLYRRLVLIEGLKDTAPIYEQSPYQTVGPDGRLTADSMIGNPIHPITLRVMSDAAYIPSDSAFTDPLVRQENTWASQDIALRDANIPRFLYDDAIEEALNKLKDAAAGQGAGVDTSKLAQGIDKIIAQLPHLENAVSDVQGRQHLKRAIDETLGLGANQAGALSQTVRSATEVATVQANVSVRLKQEQNQLLGRVLAGIRKFDALVQRYCDQQGYVEIVGQDGARKLMPFTQAHLSGRYAYDAHADSQLTEDQSSRIKRFLDFVNFFAKSPWIDQGEVARLGANEFGYDPARLIKPPPPPQPEKPNISFRFSGADLGIPEVRQILAGAGIQLPSVPSPQATQATTDAMMAQAAKATPHGGTADKADVLSKHSADHTGNMPGAPVSGAPPAAATPGRVQ